jgi:hypothetical protein
MQGLNSREIDLRVSWESGQREDADIFVVDAFPDPNPPKEERDETWRDGMWFRPGYEEKQT